MLPWPTPAMTMPCAPLATAASIRSGDMSAWHRECPHGQFGDTGDIEFAFGRVFPVRSVVEVVFAVAGYPNEPAKGRHKGLDCCRTSFGERVRSMNPIVHYNQHAT